MPVHIITVPAHPATGMTLDEHVIASAVACAHDMEAIGRALLA